jgi:hypothetical protein
MRICNSCDGTGVARFYGRPTECLQCRPASPAMHRFIEASFLATHYYQRGDEQQSWYFLLRWAELKYELVKALRGRYE